MATQKAPGSLAVVQDFVNTRDVEGASDEIATPEALRTWLAERGLMDPTAAVTEIDVRQAQSFREAIRHVLAAHAGEPLDPGAYNEMTDVAARGGVGPVFFPDDEVALQVTAAGVAGALGRIAAHVVEAISDGTWPRLKSCLNDECRWVFYDSARNRSAKWCSMAVCGNRMKARAFRARRAESEE
jgi:predicted RNA-binding Zn ribbon-like protein